MGTLAAELTLVGAAVAIHLLSAAAVQAAVLLAPHAPHHPATEEASSLSLLLTSHKNHSLNQQS